MVSGFLKAYEYGTDGNIIQLNEQGKQVQEAEKMEELLRIYRDKGTLTPAEGETLNDILAALLKMMAKYDV